MLKHLKSQEDWADKSFGAKGFTLIELLVVIIILGILAAVAIFAIGSIREDATANACETEKDTVEAAVAAFLVANPTSGPGDITGPADLDSLSEAPTYVAVPGDIDAEGAVTTVCPT